MPSMDGILHTFRPQLKQQLPAQYLDIPQAYVLYKRTLTLTNSLVESYLTHTNRSFKDEVTLLQSPHI